MFKTRINRLLAVISSFLAIAMIPSQLLAEEGGKLPQLDISNFSSQVFWLVVTFAILYLLLYKKGIPKISAVLEDRQHSIDQDLKRAEAARMENEDLQQKMEAKLAEVRYQAGLQKTEEQEKITATLEKKEAEISKSLQDRIQSAEKNIKAKRDAAISEIEDIALESCQAILERVGVQVSSASISKEVKQQLKNS